MLIVNTVVYNEGLPEMNNQAQVGRSSYQLHVRLTDELRDILQKRAMSNRRSLNSEIIVCLEKVIAEERAHGARA